MSSRLRRQTGAKMGFFAFQDIITSVTGVLVLVMLILAAHLDQSSDAAPESASDAQKQRLKGLLDEQTRLEIETRSVRESFPVVQAAPTTAQLEDDIAGLIGRIAGETNRIAKLIGQAAEQRDKTRRRDADLGLTDLSEDADKTRKEAADLEDQYGDERKEKERLQGTFIDVKEKLDWIKSQQGQVWLIPDTSTTTKEPVLAVVGSNGVTLERFDRPESRKAFTVVNAENELSRFLANSDRTKQYLVFYVRPSGIALFKRLSERARGSSFDIGFDALEEETQIHFTKPPELDQLPPKSPPAGVATGTNVATPSPTGAAPPRSEMKPAAAPPKPAVPVATPPPAKKLTWWQRLLRAIGLY